MTRLLLTGATGFAGSHCLRYVLTHTDWDVVCVVNTTSAIRRLWDVVDHDDWFFRVTAVRCDLTQRFDPSVTGAVDFVINYASDARVAESIRQPVSCVQTNVNIMLHLLEWARLAQPRAIVHVSTNEVYGPSGQRAHREWDPIIPVNPYSASKAAQEAIAIAYWRTYGVPIVLLNGANLIGERQADDKFIPTVIDRIARSEFITLWPGTRAYTHARNVADAAVFLLKNYSVERWPSSDRPDRFHVVGEREVSNYEVALKIAELMGQSLNIIAMDKTDARPGHDDRLALDGTKLASLGWKTSVSLDQALQRIIKWKTTKAGP